MGAGCPAPMKRRTKMKLSKAVRNKTTGMISVIGIDGKTRDYGYGPDAVKKAIKAAGTANRRAEYAQVMRDCGLTKVKGALGGTYWE